MSIAAKHLDPVLGIDVHIVQPPGPVPPIPVPHPFIGLILDPFDYAPYIGSTVSVNGLPRCQAGTGGYALPPHIPIGGVFIKPPGNECEAFMGSSTVLADGDSGDPGGGRDEDADSGGYDSGAYGRRWPGGKGGCSTVPVGGAGALVALLVVLRRRAVQWGRHPRP